MSPAAGASLVRALLPLIGGQVCLHSSMAGARMAAPLWALREGWSPWAAGLLLALFAVAPIIGALSAGRMVDRHGYHRPVRRAVVFSTAGAVLAALGTWSSLPWPPLLRMVLLAAGAVLAGAGANLGLIAIQRTAGRLAADGTALKQVFSWLGLAPALSNVVGPVLAGLLIDGGGFALAFGALSLLPLGAGWWARQVAVEAPPLGRQMQRGRAAFDLLNAPGMRRLLLVNWLISTSWDVHTFAVPLLGHERNLSASAIGLVLGIFAASVAGVRVLIPWLAHRLREGQVLSGSMLVTATVFAVYPFAHTAVAMSCCAIVLGIALGAVQPMIMSTLHQITPHERQGEAIALRSMAINASSAVMPLGFGAVGGVVGAGVLFWTMGALVGAGAAAARKLGGR